MREHPLYLQHEKCEFEKTCIKYLGVIISYNKVEMDPIKIAHCWHRRMANPNKQKGGAVLRQVC